jgi:hypothetical protein
VELIDRGGESYRVADPDWDAPLDSVYSLRRGGPWNAPGSFPVTYLNADITAARANARRMLTDQLNGQPFGAEDLDPSQLPILVTTVVPRRNYLDIITHDGEVANGLPETYPLDRTGRLIGHDRCQPIGQAAWAAALPGVACRSAAGPEPGQLEELAFFDRREVMLEALAIQPFEEWYGPFDW